MALAKQFDAASVADSASAEVAQSRPITRFGEVAKAPLAPPPVVWPEAGSACLGWGDQPASAPPPSGGVGAGRGAASAASLQPPATQKARPHTRRASPSQRRRFSKMSKH
eukprot:2055486-Prorocentrum_lima.AAC.1